MTTATEVVRDLRKGGTQYRHADVLSIDEPSRTLELAFSSEAAEVQTWSGVEILGHRPGEVCLHRLGDSAALLLDHNPRDQIGVVQSASIDRDQRGRAIVRFGRSPRAEEILRDVLDGIRKHVSVGYLVHQVEVIGQRDAGPLYRATDWEPIEISIVSIPADPSVGIGRALENPPQDTATVSQHTPGTPEDKTMTEPSTPAHADTTNAPQPTSNATDTPNSVDAERTRVRHIADLGKTYGHLELAHDYITQGQSPEAFQRALLTKLTDKAPMPQSEPHTQTGIGLSTQEIRHYSIVRAVRALLPNASQTDRNAAAFEIACSAAAEKTYGKQARGLLIPSDVLNRAFSTTTPTDGPGSNIIATELHASSFIEILRNKTWVMQRATVMGGLVGNVDIPRQKGTTQAYWVGEGESPEKSKPALDQIHFTPKSLAAYTDITRRLLLQSTPDAEQIVRSDLLNVMALEVDRAAIYGSGSDMQPTGVKHHSGINAVSFAQKGQPTFAELVQMETQIALNNADVNAMSYAFNAGIRGYAKTALKFPQTAASGTIWESGNTVNGYPASVSNQIKAGDVFFGNWTDLIIAMWGGLDITVDPYSLSTSGGTRIVVFQDVDFNIRRTESFCYGAAA
ncbi:phage major capsid protein [Xylella fastidiosa]|uniref:phage major capsid protein n=1 Tax=Xylella fastidiosa TaxID=2371 RepID=UPI00049A8419|nr:phage major capsid protein [Xylella fastidiosa]AIC11952.1 peptidase U35 [Xylella fastidiosa MUL0034]